MSTTQRRDSEVVIIGAGPAGLDTAASLGRVGIILAFVARQGLYLFPSIGSAIQIEIATEAVIFIIVFATVVGTFSGLYPAIRASRMKPTAAFRPK